MIQYLLFFVVLLLPLVVNPLGGDFFETPKVMVAQIAVELLVIRALFFDGSHKLWSVNTKLTWLLGLLFAISIFHQMLSPSRPSFLGNVFRLQGVFLWWHLWLVCWLSSVYKNQLPSSFGYVLLTVFTVVGALFLGTDINGRAIGSLGEANALATVAIFFWWLVFFLVPRASIIGGVLVAVVFLSTLAVIFVAQSFSALAAWSIQLVFIVLVRKRILPLSKTVVVCFGLIATSLLLPFIERQGLWENRVEIWQTAWAAGWQSPLVGHGFGTIEQAIRNAAQDLQNAIRYQYVDSGHNLILDFWIQAGVVGVAALVLLLFFSLKGMIRQSQHLEITLLIGLLTPLLFNPGSVAALVGLWWVIGRGFSKEQS